MNKKIEVPLAESIQVDNTVGVGSAESTPVYVRNEEIPMNKFQLDSEREMTVTEYVLKGIWRETTSIENASLNIKMEMNPVEKAQVQS